MKIRNLLVTATATALMLATANTIVAQQTATQPAKQSQANAPKAELKKITEVEGITQYELTSNGLKVLLYPDPSKSTVTVNITYLVGSRHEGRGEAGMAHLLEHMVFKGTPTYENIWGALQDHGASFNGTTWVDRTNYYETLPATTENLDFALHMEADRMVNSHIAQEELSKEFSVVRNEFEAGENNPIGVLFERLMSAAYLWHNYGKSTIGNRSDIERVPAKTLKVFYQKYYQPDNAMLVVAGKFDEDWTKKKIIEYFGAIPRPTRVLDDTYTEEPTQDGPRFVQLERVGSEAAAGVVYHIPAGTHPDTPAIQVLGELLTDEPSGRLYKQLVEADKAANVFNFHFQLREPGLLMVMAQLRVEQDPMAALDIITNTMENVGEQPFAADEVERIKARLLKDMKLSMTNSGSVGIELSEWEAMGDWRMMFIHRDRLKDVTVEDVNRVAKTYLMESNRTSGVFVPTENIARAEVPDAPAVNSIVEGYTGTESMARGEAFEATADNIESHTIRTTLTNNIQVAMLPKETMGDVVHGQLIFRFGDEASMTKHVTALSMMPELMMRGTTDHDYQGIRDELSRIETQLNTGGGPGAVMVTLKTTRDRLPEAIALATEILRQPTFPADELEVMRKQQLAQLEQSKTMPEGLVFNALMRAMAPYPPDDIHYVPTIDEQIERTNAVTRDEIERLYKALVGASNLDAAFVGDFNPEEVQSLLTSSFGDWKSPLEYKRVESKYIASKELNETINTPDKQNALVARATTLQIRDDDEYFPALDFANYVLGQSPKSRLLTALRHEGGMSYGAGSFVQASDTDKVGAIGGYAICNPGNAPKVQKVMQDEFASWIQDGIAPEELEEFKAGYLEGYKTRLGSDQFVVNELADGLKIGRTFAYHQRLIDAVEDLTPEDIQQALSTYLSNAKFADMKGGDASKFETPGGEGEGGEGESGK